MYLRPDRNELRQRRYPVLYVFDVTLNVLLSAGIFALGCACFAIIMANNAPYVLSQISFIASHILGNNPG